MTKVFSAAAAQRKWDANTAATPTATPAAAEKKQRQKQQQQQEATKAHSLVRTHWQREHSAIKAPKWLRRLRRWLRCAALLLQQLPVDGGGGQAKAQHTYTYTEREGEWEGEQEGVEERAHNWERKRAEQANDRQAKAKVFPNHFYSQRNAKINSSSNNNTTGRPLQGSLLSVQVVGFVVAFSFICDCAMNKVKELC